jgi:hypothetical protein
VSGSAFSLPPGPQSFADTATETGEPSRGGGDKITGLLDGEALVVGIFSAVSGCVLLETVDLL